MRKFITSFAIIGMASIFIISCKKEAQPVAQQAAISAEVLAQIKALGFSNTNVEKIEEGYLVEGDIILTPQDLASTTTMGVALRIANTEQYRTTNLVTGLPRNITVALSSQLPTSYVTVLDEMIRRYNAEGLRITFSRVSSNANITFTKANGNYLASAGFPAQGNPYNNVKINSRAIGSGTSTTFINYAATIFAHEVGHCIGFRHTDYMDRSYSCGGGYSNEGASTVGAINIPGTPATAEPNSWMLACISANQNRPFDAYDKTALSYLYK